MNTNLFLIILDYHCINCGHKWVHSAASTGIIFDDKAIGTDFQTTAAQWHRLQSNLGTPTHYKHRSHTVPICAKCGPRTLKPIPLSLQPQQRTKHENHPLPLQTKDDELLE